MIQVAVSTFDNYHDSNFASMITPDDFTFLSYNVITQLNHHSFYDLDVY